MNTFTVGLGLVRFVLCAALVSLPGATALSQPVITSLSASTLARSGRLRITGTGFGATQGSSTFRIGGVLALITTWSDTLVTAYVPEFSPTGPVNVQLTAGGLTSNPAALSVTLRQSDRRVRWRFQADSPYFFPRPAIGPDGSIIAHDAGGFVYALAPDGALKWIYHTRTFASGPPSVGTDGTVYVGNSTTITAFNSDGTFKWSFDDPNGSRSLAVGPTVGPDGKIYAFFDVFHIYAFTPQGAIAWHNMQTNLLDLFEYGAEMAFGPSHAGQAADRAYLSFGVNPNGFLWAFNMTNGAVEWTHLQVQTWDSAMQPQGQSVTGPDGTIYTACRVLLGSSSSPSTPSTPTAPSSGGLSDSAASPPPTSALTVTSTSPTRRATWALSPRREPPFGTSLTDRNLVFGVPACTKRCAGEGELLFALIHCGPIFPAPAEGVNRQSAPSFSRCSPTSGWRWRAVAALAGGAGGYGAAAKECRMAERRRPKPPTCLVQATAGCAGRMLPLDLIPLPGGGAAEEAGAAELFVAEGGHRLNGRGTAGGDENGWVDGRGPCVPGARWSYLGGFSVPTPPQTGAAHSSPGGFFTSPHRRPAFRPSSGCAGGIYPWPWRPVSRRPWRG
jgi:hypothetical protein